jgi:hypothetical protein
VECLRFDTIIGNFGKGALELHYRTDRFATDPEVIQRVYRSNGSHVDRRAGTYEFEASHGHFHYAGMAQGLLWRSNSAGARLGLKPVATGEKDGFCMEDMQKVWVRGPKTPRYQWPDACYPMDTSNGGLDEVNGLSVGWEDVYNLWVPHQYIEVSDVRDGYYLLEIRLDPMRRLAETTRADDTVWQRIRLCGDKVDLIGSTNRCGRGGA